MKKWLLAVMVLAVCVGGIAAIMQSSGRPEKIKGCTIRSGGVIGQTDGPTSLFFSGKIIPSTWTSFVRKLSAAICRIAAAFLCGSRKK